MGLSVYELLLFRQTSNMDTHLETIVAESAQWVRRVECALTGREPNVRERAEIEKERRNEQSEFFG